jgi:hypothetical protein
MIKKRSFADKRLRPIPESSNPPRLPPSPEGTFGQTICDGENIWRLGVDTATLRWDGEGGGSLYCWSGGTVYVLGADQWYSWTGTGWLAYGMNPPIPMPVPEPIPPPAGMPPRLYHTSSWTQALCMVGTATPVVIYGITAFALVEQIAHGRESDAVRFLDWCASQRLNMVRVLVTCWNMFRLTPDEGRAALPRLLELAGARGLYVEVVCIADTYREEGDGHMVENYPGYDWAAHVAAVGVLCADYPNSLVELVNEPMQPWQPFAPEQLQAFSAGIPAEVPFTLGACDDGYDESTAYCSDHSSYQTVHADRNRAPWGNVRHIREQQVMSNEINQYVWNDEPGKEFTPAQHFAIGALCRVCMIADTFHSNCVRYAEIPTGEELEWFLARRAGWDAVADGDWGTFANYGWMSPNPEPPIESCWFHDEDGRAYSLLCPGNQAYTVLLNAKNPTWKPGWQVMSKEERTNRADGEIETGLYHVYRNG